jgi:molybdopterin converting factor small subunit
LLNVQVRLGAGLATAAGTRRLRLVLPQDATVGTLLEQVRELEPAIAAGLDSALPVLRGTQVSRAQGLAEGDEVALLIPVAGGAGRKQRRQEWP